MTHVSIIGTGNMSQGISGLVTKGGNRQGFISPQAICSTVRPPR